MNKYCFQNSRRGFIKNTSSLIALYMAPSVLVRALPVTNLVPMPPPKEKLRLTINGKPVEAEVDIRMTLLDFLREQLGMTGTKKGCAMGQCGACIIHVNGKRTNSCLSLAVYNNGNSITTIEGLANGDQLHPMQAAFAEHDSMQCGYCTPGQIMSAIACVREGQATSLESVQRYMSGNICRCGAYQNITDAILAVSKSGKPV